MNQHDGMKLLQLVGRQIAEEAITELVKPELATKTPPSKPPPLKKLTVGEIVMVDALSHSSGDRAVYPEMDKWKLEGLKI